MDIYSKDRVETDISYGKGEGKDLRPVAEILKGRRL